MGRRLTLASHLSTEELEQRYKSAKGGIERGHYHSLSAPVPCRYDWFWLYGFVHPRSGQTYWWLLPRVNIDLFNRALADFAEHFGIGPKHRVVLVMDQAGWHTSEQVVVPEGLHPWVAGLSRQKSITLHYSSVPVN